MGITSISQQQIFDVTNVTVVSDLVGAPIYYWWYLDGSPVLQTTTPTQNFRLSPYVQVDVRVIDTLDANFDAVANAPLGYPATRSLWFVRSIDAAADHYIVQQRVAGTDTWSTIGQIQQIGPQWTQSIQTQPLDDLTSYEWQVVPCDAAGNEGPPLALPAELIVRRPDAPAWSMAYDPETFRVSFAAA